MEAQHLDQKIHELVKGMSPEAGLLVLKEFNSIPFVIKDAVEDFYAAMEDIEELDSIDLIKDALARLKKACEANPQYKGLYDVAKSEAKDAIADVIANEGIDIFNDDE